MNKIDTKENINAHYTTETKIIKPEHIVVQGPNNIPKQDLFTDQKANVRLQAIEQDIFDSTKRVKKNNEKKKKILGLF